MEDSFDRERADRRHREILDEAERIRDGLTKDVIDYYYDSPTSEDEEREKNEGMRRYLRRAADDIDSLLREKFS